MDTPAIYDETTRRQMIFEGLRDVTIQRAIESFLDTLGSHTRRSYDTGLNIVFELFEDLCLIRRELPLQVLAMCNVENLLDALKKNVTGSEATKQARACAFLSFTKFLERTTGGVIRSALTNKSCATPTFPKIRSKSATTALTLEEWRRFSNSLRMISERDSLIAKMMIQGAKRVREVTSARIEQIDWENRRITFAQSKSAIRDSVTVITYPADFMSELKSYLAGRNQGLIFLTRNGKEVSQAHLHRNFSHASVAAGLNKRVHPHVLRASAITILMGQGYHSDQIMQVSGHADTGSVLYYDKSKIEDNITREVRLI